MIQNDFRFKLSLSHDKVEKEEHKNVLKDIEEIAFYEDDFTVDSFAFYIKQGRAYCGLFKHEEHDFYIVKKEGGILKKTGVKTKENWIGSQVIPIDCDAFPLSYDEVLEIVKETDLCPTIMHTTLSDGIKGNQFRLIYVIDEIIRDESEYQRYWISLWNALLHICGTDAKVDNSSKSLAQLMLGNFRPDCKLRNFRNILSIRELQEISDLYAPIDNGGKRQVNAYIKERVKDIESRKENFNLTDEFAEEFDKLSFTEILCSPKNICRFDLVERSFKIDFKNRIGWANDGTYYEIKRPFVWRDGRPVKYVRKDGHKRKKHLFVMGMLKRILKPTISTDELLFNLIYEVNTFVDNSEDPINKSDLLGIVERTMNADMDAYIDTLTTHLYLPSFKINTELCRRLHIDFRTVKINEILDLRGAIIRYADSNKTAEENANMFQEMGFMCSRKTLDRYVCKLKEENRLSAEFEFKHKNNKGKGYSKGSMKTTRQARKRKVNDEQSKEILSENNDANTKNNMADQTTNHDGTNTIAQTDNTTMKCEDSNVMEHKNIDIENKDNTFPKVGYIYNKRHEPIARQTYVEQVIKDFGFEGIRKRAFFNMVEYSLHNKISYNT